MTVLGAVAAYAGDVSGGEKPVAPADVYVQRCGVCHLESGEGVPGAFPPLDGRLAGWAGSQQGQRYLVNVLTNGLYGAIDVDGTRYFGAMPGMAQQIDSAEMAGLLNYVITTFADGEATFTAEMVGEIRTVNGAAASLGLRPQ